MTQLITYLSFDGNCREAFEFYQAQLDGEIVRMMTWGEGPMAEQVSEAMHDRVMHASLKIGGFMLMGDDTADDAPYEGIKGAGVVLDVPAAAEAERVFQALSDGCRIRMPMEETFWAHRFGMAVDRFGVPWMVNCGKEDWQ